MSNDGTEKPATPPAAQVVEAPPPSMKCRAAYKLCQALQSHDYDQMLRVSHASLRDSHASTIPFAILMLRPSLRDSHAATIPP